MRPLRIIIISLFICIFPFIYVHATPLDYIVDTDIGGDIDDVLALLMALDNPVKPLAITTTHIEPEEKARIAKLIMTIAGFPNIPVYAGIGTARNNSRELFLQQNPLWPPSFGYPEPLPGEKKWFALQAAPYKKVFGALFENTRIEKETAPEFIARIAKSYSPQHKLIIAAIGPLHNIAAALMIDPSISHNIKIVSMGGIYPKGYNWLVSPETTAIVLSQVEVICVLRSFIEANQFYMTKEEFESLEKNTQSSLGQAVIQDWKNWYKMDAGDTKKTYLSDPVTLYLAIHPEEIAVMQAKDILFPCLDENGNLKPEFSGLWYNMPNLENKLIKVINDESSNIKVVYQVQSAPTIRKKIIATIAKYLTYPG